MVRKVGGRRVCVKQTPRERSFHIADMNSPDAGTPHGEVDEVATTREELRTTVSCLSWCQLRHRARSPVRQGEAEKSAVDGSGIHDQAALIPGAAGGNSRPWPQHLNKSALDL